jgi:tRNA threonylcarbamoyladenosine biosynthesis protein TsaB
MHLLGIDTSGKQGSVALARGDADSFEVLAVAPIAGGTFSAQLVPQIASMLNQHKLSKKDIGGIAAASGPGSFTGLRVGLAAVKGLAEILKVPIATVSVLEAMAVTSGYEGSVVAALDAGRGEVFAGEFSVQNGAASLCKECLLTREEFADVLGVAPRHVVTSDPTIADFLASRNIDSESLARPGSDLIARIGRRKILAGDTVTPAQLDANYLRRSDAEIFSSKGSN